MSADRKTKILVPVYNGADYIRPFIKQLSQIQKESVIFINDGSTDCTQEYLEQENVQVVSHHINFGKGHAIMSGLKQAISKDCDHIITIDIDLQHPIEKLGSFYQQANKGIILGFRNDRRNMPVHRQISNFLTSLLISIRTNRLIKDSQCGYRNYPLKLFDELKLKENGFQFESEILIKAALLGYSINHCNIPTIYNKTNSSKINPIVDTAKFILLWFRSFFW